MQQIPLNNDVIAQFVAALQQTLDPNQSVRGPAEQKLFQWEVLPGFCSVLIEIITNASIDPHVRMAATLSLKNAVDRHWKKRMNGKGEPLNVEISPNEKALLREKLLQTFSEPVQKIALQTSILISIIVRHDFPQAWPDVLQNISQVIQNTQVQLQRERALLALHHIIKALSSRRLQASRTDFEKMAPGMFTFITFLWNSSTDSIVKAFDGYLQRTVNDQQLQLLASAIETNKLCLKINRRLIVFGIPHYNKHKPVVDFIGNTHVEIGNMTRYRASLPRNHFASDSIYKLAIEAGKLILEVQKAWPLAFVTLEASIKFFSDQLLQLAVTNDERFTVQCMLFIKNVLDCDKYVVDLEHPSAAKTEADRVIKTVFSQDLVKNLCYTLITKLFPMTTSNLEEWESNPEDFFNEEELESWQDKKKPCAETLYLTLLDKYGDWLCPEVLKMLQPVLQATPSSLEEILLKDSAYLALGLGSYQLHDAIDFASWFVNTLSKELQVSDPRYKILRRRIAYLLSCWVTKIPKEMRRAVYQVLVGLIQEGDLVVSLTAANSLKRLVDDIEFYIDGFLEFLNPVISLLFNLLQRVEDCDAKLKVLSLITVLIQQLEERIIPYTPQIVENLRQQWKLAEPHESYNLLKQAIVTALSKLVQCSMPDQTRLKTYEFVIPIIQHSTDISQSDSLYLMDEGLLLWKNLVEQAPQINEAVLKLFPNLVAITNQTYEHTKVSMRIIEEYLVLGKGDFLKAFGNPMLEIFMKTIGNVRDEAAVWIVKPIEIFIQLFPQEAGYFDAIYQKVLSEVFALTDSTPWVVSHYLTVLARLLLHNPEYFFSFFNKVGLSNLWTVMDIWLEKFDTMGQQKMKKLSVMALTQFLVTRQPEILQYISQILSLAVATINFEMDMKGKESSEDFELFVDDEELSTKNASAAKQLLFTRDPVQNTNLHDFVMQKLNECVALNGDQIKSAIDPAIVQGIQALTARRNSGQ